MIIIEFNNGDTMKLVQSDYDVYSDHGCLYVRKIINSHSETKYIIPLNTILMVTFD